MVMNLANALATVASVALLDSVGRRPLLLASIASMGAAAGGLTAALDHADEWWAPTACVFSVGAFVAAFGVGLGPVVPLMPAELFPAQHRASGSAIAWSAHWIGNFATAQSFLFQYRFFGSALFAPHAAALTIGLVFAAASVPETRGKSLEQIEHEMSAT